MNEELNEIQIIQKPVFVALLEMVADVNDSQNIPWFSRIDQYLSDPAAWHCRASFDIEGNGLHYDDDGNLIGINLSHLNLTGTIRLESLPQSVRTLDLSFNNLLTLRFPKSTRKSLETLNIEQNEHIQLDTKCLSRIFARNGTSRTLQLSSNQIFSSKIVSGTGSRTKRSRIRHWMYHQQMFDVLVVDGQTIHSTESTSFYSAMLNVVEGVTNKELIPWYQLFTDGQSMLPHQWRALGIVQRGRPRSSKRTYSMNLSGLGLKGHIDLGSLPRALNALDLSNNNLSSISFFGNGQQYLRELNLQNNDGLIIEFDASSQPIAHFIESSGGPGLSEFAAVKGRGKRVDQ